ncbi:homocysteine S-methyltransferase family protein [Leptothoe spongobia]|uniref:Homocysteine S-methyltransferase family protein n=1 Tax=Leptothoe spongobia TAU-MAC 1115 TaxID=1967444 RepID=A0A947DJ17_9CYAN|nr:homocysteine S-methyltransferase family protein [Leptothoe spongobia]MBT9317174.1 homocysteine S-methyltransferase family protein [Leptothoe spongobia TAU-MAC 1115]
MAYYRHQLPQLSDSIFITDGGLETVMLFQQGWDLPDFAAFTLMDRPLGTEALHNYFNTYGTLAKTYGMGLVLESPTWRASADWGSRQGYDAARLADVNRRAIALLQLTQTTYDSPHTPIVISGCIGPRGDGYSPNDLMDAETAEQYHQAQINAFQNTAADLVSAITMTYPEEAIGITRAASKVQMPVVISFTVETDGKLPNGTSLKEAIRIVDTATDSAPAYYMINCAHPIHFDRAILNQGPWVERIRGIRANASMMSHAELDEAETLDDGNPQDLGERFYLLRRQLPHLNVLGGCCGTDHRHIEAICKTCSPVLAE